MKTKGISPIISAVLLIAFTISIAGLFGPWASKTIQAAQEGTGERAMDIQKASQLGLEVVNADYSRSSDRLDITLQNTGEEIGDETNISIGVIGGSDPRAKVFDDSIGERSIKSFNLSIEQTYLLENVKADLTAFPVSSTESLVCTVTEGLYSYWSFNSEQTSDNLTLGLSPHRINATINGSSTAPGKVGGAYSFDGSDDHLEFNDTGFFNGSYDFTVAGWVKHDQVNRSKPQDYFSPRNASMIEIREINSKMQLGWWNGSSWNNVKSQEIQAGDWYFFTGVWDADGEAVLYLDGERQAGISTDAPANYGGINSVGMRGNYANYMDGIIDEMRFYNRTLSSAEINALREVTSKEAAVNACGLS